MPRRQASPARRLVTRQVSLPQIKSERIDGAGHQDRTADNVSDCLGGPYFKRPPWWTSLPILLVYGLRHTQLASTALAISLIRSSRAALIPSMRDPFTTPLSMGASSPIDEVHCHSSMPPRGLTESGRDRRLSSSGFERMVNAFHHPAHQGSQTATGNNRLPA